MSRRIPEAGLRRLREAQIEFEIGQEDPDLPIEQAELLEGVRRHDVLLCLLTERVDHEVLTANPGLRGVSNMAVGVDNIDVGQAERLGIPVGNTPGVLTDATADLTWALLLAAARRVPQADAYMRAGRFEQWGPELMCGLDVGPGVEERRKVLGIVGWGRIGRAVARRAVGFDMEVLVSASPRAPAGSSSDGVERVAVDELLARSDFVSLHVPLTDETHGLIGAAEFRAMRRSAVLINTARGPVVDESALVAALRDGEIAAAGLDVFEREPAMAPGLAGCDNVVILPHIGSATHATRNRMAVMAAENAIRFSELRR